MLQDNSNNGAKGDDLGSESLEQTNGEEQTTTNKQEESEGAMFTTRRVSNSYSREKELFITQQKEELIHLKKRDLPLLR